MSDDSVLVWSLEHGIWRLPGSLGYTVDRQEAGLYPRAAAEAIVQAANIGCPSDAPSEEIVELGADGEHGDWTVNGIADRG